MQNSVDTKSGEPIARKSFLLYASSLANSGIRWVTLAVVANLLGSKPLGIIAYAYAFIGFFQFLYEFGLNKSHMRRIADGEDAGKCVGAYIVVKAIAVALTTLIILGAFGLHGWLGGQISGVETQVFALVLVSMIISHLFQFPVDTFTARKEIARRVTLDTVANLVDLPVILAIFYLAGQKSAMGLAWAHLANKCIWAAASVALFYRAARHDGYRLSRPPWRLVRSYVAFSIPLLGSLGIATLAVNTDMVMVREFADSAALGNYHVANRVMMGVLAVSAAVMTLVLPTISRYFAVGDKKALNALLSKSERYISLLTTYAAMGMIVFAEQIVLVFGSDFTVVAPPVIRLFGIVTFFTAVNRPFSAVPLAVNRPWVSLKVTGVLIFANAALNLCFMPDSFAGMRMLGLGATGCALSTAIVSALGFVWARSIAWQLARAKTYGGIAGHILAASIAGAACFLLKPYIIYGTRWEILLKTVAMGVAALPLYLAALAAMGLIRRSDVSVFTSLFNPRKIREDFSKELFGRAERKKFRREESARADLVLIDYGVAAEVLPGIIECARSKAADGARIVLFRSRLPYNVESMPNLKLSEDYLADGDYPAIDSFCFGLAERWHRFETGAKSELPAAARCAEYKTAERMLQIVKDKFILARILAEKGAANVLLYSGSPLFSEVARSFCGERELTLAIVPCGEKEIARPKSVFAPREWNGILGGVRDILENIAFIRAPRKKDKQRGQTPLFVLFDGGEEWVAIHDGSRFRRLFDEAGLPVADYHDYSAALPRGEKMWRRIARILPRLAKNRLASKGRAARYGNFWRELKSLDAFKAQFNYRGVNFWAEIEPYLDDLFHNRLPEISRRIERREIIYRALDVKAIIVNDGVQLAKRIDLEAGRRIGARSLLVQHGVCGETNGESGISTDLAAVWGEEARSWYIRAGNPAERLKVTGNPKFDAVTRHIARPPADWRVEHCPKAVVFATQPAPKRSAYDTDDEEEVLADAVIREMSHIEGRRFVIKLHPNQKDREATYRRYVAHYGLENCEVLRDVELGRLLCNCEMFITESSTAAMEAVLWDVPIMIVNLTRRADIVPYVPGGVAAGVYEEDEIEATLRRLLADEGMRSAQAARRARFIAGQMFRIDGNSAGRVYEIASALAGGGEAEGAMADMDRHGRARTLTERR